MNKKIKFVVITISLFIFLGLIVKKNFFNFNEYIFEKLPNKAKVIIRTVKKNNQNNQGYFQIFNNYMYLFVDILILFQMLSFFPTLMSVH